MQILQKLADPGFEPWFRNPGTFGDVPTALLLTAGGWHVPTSYKEVTSGVQIFKKLADPRFEPWFKSPRTFGALPTRLLLTARRWPVPTSSIEVIWNADLQKVGRPEIRTLVRRSGHPWRLADCTSADC